MNKTPLLALAAALVMSSGCSDDNDAIAPASVAKYDQVDRKARPAVNTLFLHTDGNPVAIEPADGTSPKDQFNLGTPATDAAMWTNIIESSLRVFRSLDNVPENDDSGDIDVFTSVLSTDVLILDLSASGTSTFLGVELGVENSTGGRALADDVVDAALSAVLFPGAATPFISDNVDANDRAFLSTFPYLAEPN